MASGSSASDSHQSLRFSIHLLILENEKTQKGRKRKLDPANWKKKHIKTCGLRKNSPSLTITEDMECCLTKC